MNTIEAIEGYLSALEKAGWGISRYRQEKESRIRQFFAQELENPDIMLSLTKPFEQIFEYFSRVAGLDAKTVDLTLDQQVLLPSWVPQSMQEAIELWTYLLTAPDFPKPLFPIMQDYFGNYLCVDVSERGLDRGKVFVCLEGFFPWPKYENISALFEIHTKCVEKGIIYIEDGKYLEVKDEEMSELIDEFPDLAKNPPN